MLWLNSDWLLGLGMQQRSLHFFALFLSVLLLLSSLLLLLLSLLQSQAPPSMAALAKTCMSAVARGVWAPLVGP
jgi:hypothetical protein